MEKVPAASAPNARDAIPTLTYSSFREKSRCASGLLEGCLRLPRCAGPCAAAAAAAEKALMEKSALLQARIRTRSKNALLPLKEACNKHHRSVHLSGRCRRRTEGAHGEICILASTHHDRIQTALLPYRPVISICDHFH